MRARIGSKEMPWLVELGLLAFSAVPFIIGAMIAIKTSIWLGIVTTAALLCGAFYLLYNYDYWLVRWLARKDPLLIMKLCETGAVARIRRVVGKLPADPRCRFCRVPFAGVGSVLRIKPAAKNPNFCRSCFEGLPLGSRPTEVGILFADVRNYTSWTETHSPREAADALVRFYAIAERALTSDDALVEFVGDQIMVLYVTAFPSLGDRTPEVMLNAAKRLVTAIQKSEDALPVGVGLNRGVCEVGNIAKGQSKDFTAVGDAVNTTARLQSSAQAYQIVMSETVYAGAGVAAEAVQRTTLNLKGKAEPMTAYIVDLTERASV